MLIVFEPRKQQFSIKNNENLEKSNLYFFQEKEKLSKKVLSIYLKIMKR